MSAGPLQDFSQNCPECAEFSGMQVIILCLLKYNPSVQPEIWSILKKKV